MVNCFPRNFDRTVSHFVGAQIKSVISVLTRLHEPLLVPDRDIVVMTESAHTESCLYRRSINVCQRNRTRIDLCDLPLRGRAFSPARSRPRRIIPSAMTSLTPTSRPPCAGAGAIGSGG